MVTLKCAGVRDNTYCRAKWMHVAHKVAAMISESISCLQTVTGSATGSGSVGMMCITCKVKQVTFKQATL